MWFAFGLITLLSFCVFSFWMRAEARWSGDAGVTGGIAYVSRIDRNKSGKPRRLRIGMRAADTLEFTLKREGWLDRLFKGMGFASEFQVGREEFDRTVYIVSDDQGLCRRLAGSREVQADILALFDARQLDVEVKKLRCLFGRMWIEFGVGSAFKEESVPLVARDVAAPLHRLADLTARVSADRSVSEEENRDPFVLRAIIILSVSTALAINGLVQMLRALFDPVPFTLDDFPLTALTVFAGLILLALLVAAVVNFLGRSSRAHMVLIEVLLVGGFGCFATACMALRDYNMEWDTGAEVRFEVPVRDMRVSRGKSTSYYVTVADWTQPAGRREIKVRGGFYGAVKIGEVISVHQMPGALGMAWVSKLSSARGVVLD